MPGPLLHLVIAKDGLQNLGFNTQILENNYYLGSIMPDVRYAWGVNRRVTHSPRGLPSLVQAAADIRIAVTKVPEISFCAGYQTHLQADKIWASDIYPIIIDTIGRFVPQSNSVAYLITDLYYQRKISNRTCRTYAKKIINGKDENLMLKILECPKLRCIFWKLVIERHLSGMTQCLILRECDEPSVKFELIQKAVDALTDLDDSLEGFIDGASEAASDAIRGIIEESKGLCKSW